MNTGSIIRATEASTAYIKQRCGHSTCTHTSVDCRVLTASSWPQEHSASPTAMTIKNVKNGSNGRKKDPSPGLWIAPHHSLKGAHGERAWGTRRDGPPNSNGFMELADIALGLKKPAPRAPRIVVAAHVTSHKTEPYLS